MVTVILIAVLSYSRSIESDEEGVAGFTKLIDGTYGGVDSAAHIIVRDHVVFGEEFPSFMIWILTPIPRILWDEKPVSLGQVMGNEMGHGKEFGGPTVPFYAEMYRSGGIIALIIGMLVMGWVTSVIEWAVIMRSSSYIRIAMVFVYVKGVLELVILPFSDALIAVLMFIVPLFIIHFASSIRLPRWLLAYRDHAR